MGSNSGEELELPHKTPRMETTPHNLQTVGRTLGNTIRGLRVTRARSPPQRSVSLSLDPMKLPGGRWGLGFGDDAGTRLEGSKGFGRHIYTRMQGIPTRWFETAQQARREIHGIGCLTRARRERG
jgi:hypothetical protein